MVHSHTARHWGSFDLNIVVIHCFLMTEHFKNVSECFLGFYISFFVLLSIRLRMLWSTPSYLLKERRDLLASLIVPELVAGVLIAVLAVGRRGLPVLH